MVAPVRAFAFVEDELDTCHLRILHGGSEQAVEELLRPEHHETDVEPGHFPTSLTGERFACRTQVARADEHDVRRLEHVLQLHDQLFGPTGDVFNPLFPLLVAELPEQQERNEHEREGEQDVGLNNVQEVQDQGLNFTILFGSSRLCELTSLTARCQAAP